MAAEHAAIVRDVSESLGVGKAPVTRVMPDGSQLVTLPGDSAVVMARRGADGRIEQTCVGSPEEAEQFLAGSTPRHEDK